MNKITSSYLICCFIFFSSFITLQAQNVWWKTSEAGIKRTSITTSEYAAIEIEGSVLSKQLEQTPYRFSKTKSSKVIVFPNEYGAPKQYSIQKIAVLHPALAKKFPSIESYIGRSLDGSNETVRFVYSPYTGIKGVISRSGKTTIGFKPHNKRTHVFYSTKNEIIDADFDCSTEAFEKVMPQHGYSTNRNADDGNLRRYRLALSVSGEYAQFFLDGTEINDQERKAKVLVAMIATMNRVNGIYERDFGVTMQMIPENDELIFLDPRTDPYSGRFGFKHELQSTIDDHPNIGSANYDVGHLFHVEGSVYGNAGCIACVCTDGKKAGAYTVHNAPDSDHFNMIVAHEFGHQFGGYHVQSSSNCRSGNNSEVEPGSGSSIMGYAGICPTNVQQEPDDYFNYVDIRDVAIWTINNSNCAEVIPTGNTAPVANAGNDYTIPKSTPFILEGSAVDGDGTDQLTYCWEQNNPENPLSSASPQPTWDVGPLFRSRQPTDTPVRYMPQLEDVIQGNLTPTWEVLPAVSRTMVFELTVRDNAIEGGQTATDEKIITVDEASGPFMVTSQQTFERWNVGEEVVITWDVANTNVSPVSEANVDILLSVDGGRTYPHLLVDNTLNDGVETLTVPDIAGADAARVMVRASNNIFYSINTADFKIQTTDFEISKKTDNTVTCEGVPVDFTIDYQTFVGFQEKVTFSAVTPPAGLSIVFDPVTIEGIQNNKVPVKVTVSGTENLGEGTYPLTIKGTSLSGIEKTLIQELKVYENRILPSGLISPANGEKEVLLQPVLEWEENSNVDFYEIEVASDSNFNTLIESFRTESTSFSPQPLMNNTTYYWRVRSTNPCGSAEVSAVFTFITKCNDVTNFRSTGVGINSVDLSWDDIYASEWEIEFGEFGFTQGTGTKITVTTNPYTVEGLQSNTLYDFYIKPICTGGGIATGLRRVVTAEDFCGGNHFYDSGGVDGDYKNHELTTTVMVPSSVDERVRVSFLSFDLEECCDHLRIYDGPNTDAPLLGQYSGNSPGEIASSHESGALTFVFDSDSSVTGAGWDAVVFCEPKPNCTKPENIRVLEMKTTSVELEWDVTNEVTSYEIEYGAAGFVRGTGTVLSSVVPTIQLDNLIGDSEYDLYVFANCSVGRTEASFFSFRTGVKLCGEQYFYDSGGASGEYSNNENKTYVLIPDHAEDKVKVVFEQFLLEGCCDKLVIYDGPSSAYPLIGEYRTTSPGEITSTHESGTLTFVFTSDGSVTRDGWAAKVSCVSQNSCEAPSDLEVMSVGIQEVTLSWRGNQQTTSSWEIEYGASGFIAGTGTKVTSESTEIILNGLDKNTYYEAYVRGNCTQGGTSSKIGPIRFKTHQTLCSEGQFYDSGGSDGNYGNNETETTVLQPMNIGKKVKVDFTSFELDDCCDVLHIYDGPDTTFPLIGSYSATKPETIISTHDTGALTFVFVSNESVSGTGWEATVSCVSLCEQPVLLAHKTITATTAIIVIRDEQLQEGSFEIEYGKKGFTRGEGNTYISDTKEILLEALEPGVVYEYYVRTICDSGLRPKQIAVQELKTLTVSEEVMIYPNPSNGNFMMTYGGESRMKEMLLFDIKGTLIAKKQVGPFNKEKEMNWSYPRSGVYFIKVIFDTHEEVRKVMFY